MALSKYERDLRHRRIISGAVGIGSRSIAPIARIDQVRNHLRDAFEEQSYLIASGRYAAFRGVKGRAFVDEFLRDPLFPPLFREARHVATSEPDNDQFEKRVRGAAFELMADLYLASHDKSPTTPLTGTIAAEVQTILKPHLEVSDFGLGQVGIMGQILYDGFMVTKDRDGEPHVHGAIEATLMMDWRRSKERQIGGVRSFFADLEHLGAEDPYLVLVTPKPEDRRRRESRCQVVGNQTIELAYLPVSSDLLMVEFLPYLFKEHPGRKGRTLAQERNRWLASSAGRKLKMGEPALYRRS